MSPHRISCCHCQKNGNIVILCFAVIEENLIGSVARFDYLNGQAAMLDEIVKQFTI
jgi:hypothetical protein